MQFLLGAPPLRTACTRDAGANVHQQGRPRPDSHSITVRVDWACSLFYSHAGRAPHDIVLAPSRPNLAVHSSARLLPISVQNADADVHLGKLGSVTAGDLVDAQRRELGLELVELLKQVLLVPGTISMAVLCCLQCLLHNVLFYLSQWFLLSPLVVEYVPPHHCQNSCSPNQALCSSCLLHRVPAIPLFSVHASGSLPHAFAPARAGSNGQTGD